MKKKTAIENIKNSIDQAEEGIYELEGRNFEIMQRRIKEKE